MKRVETLDVSRRSQGFVDYCGDAGGHTHDSITFTAYEYNRNGNVRRKVRIRLGLFDAALIAGLFSKALVARDQHTQRLKSIADGTGY